MLLNSMGDPQELLREILRGNITRGFPDPPSRTVKIYICSTATDFINERRHFHEFVFPELQRFCSARGLDLQLVDPHWHYHSDACDRNVVSNVNSEYIDPHEFALQMNEIADCFRISMTTFFICFIGHKYKPSALPLHIDSNNFNKIYTYANEAGLGDTSLLHQWYREDANMSSTMQYTLMKKCGRKLSSRASSDSTNVQKQEQDVDENHLKFISEMEQVIKILEYGTKVALKETGIEINPFLSAVHTQVKQALNLCKDNGREKIISVVRRFEGK
ncbi:Leucine-rich repeat and WD repeat-containing protein-like protein, partial [Dinothrombium tinctorium]